MAEDTIAPRLARIQERIAAAAARVGRSATDVTLCAVTKTFPADAVRAALDAGVSVVGENRVQEADEKQAGAGAGAAWHLIGHLQSNKARRAVEIFDCIQSIDSVKLATRVASLCTELDRRLDLYVQVDLGLEATKTGAIEAEVPAILDVLDGAPNVTLAGLMTVPPFSDDPEGARPYFRKLRELRDALNASGRLARSLDGLSMGMSHDFEVAVEEGATLVRVGSALFGRRPAQ